MPFNYVDYANEIEKYVSQIEKNYGVKLKSNGIDFVGIKEKLKLFKVYADSLFKIRNFLTKVELQKIEQKFTRKSGLPNRDWYKHRIYAPGYYLGYGSQPLPGISEMLSSGNFEVAKREIKLLEEIVDEVVKEIQTILKNKKEVK